MGAPDWIVLPLEGESTVDLLNELFERGWYLNDERLMMGVDREALIPHGSLQLRDHRRREPDALLVVLTNAGCACRQRAVVVPRDDRGRADYAEVLTSNPGWDLLVGTQLRPGLHVAILQETPE